MELAPPDDPTVATLWLGNVEADISEGDLREVMYPYGHIQNIHLVRSSKCAFVEFASREMAENAARELYRAMIVKDKVINVNWSKPRQPVALGGGSGPSHDDGPLAMLPPPGMEKAPPSAYQLPDIPMPFMPPPPMGLPSAFLNHQTPRPPPLGPGPNPTLDGAAGASIGFKRPQGDMAIAEGLDGQLEQKRVQPRPPPSGPGPASLYPSMNPSRMGAKI